MSRFFITVSLILLLHVLNIADAASFNCSKASTPLEKLICKDPDINRIDGMLGKIYFELIKKKAPGKKRSFKNKHRKWLRERTNCNLNRECLYLMYRKRVTSMIGELSEIENKENFVGTYKARNDGCGFFLKIYKEKGVYRYHLKTNKKDAEGFLFLTYSDNIYLTFDGLLCDDPKVPVSGAYMYNMIVIQNYGNSMNQYTKFSECGPKYIEISKIKK